MRLQFAAASLLFVTLMASPATAEDGDLSLRHSGLLLRAPRGDRAPDHRVTLRAGFPVGAFADTFDPALDDVVIRIGPNTIFELASEADHGRVRQRDRYRWTYRGPRVGKRRGPILRLDVAMQTVTLRARGLDLRALLTHGPGDVEVALLLGDREFVTRVDFRVRRHRWRYRHGMAPFVPGTGGGGRTLPPDGPVAWTSLANGSYSGITGTETHVLRTQREWTALWARHQAGTTGGPQAPALDFSQDMVLAIFAGTRSTGGYMANIDSIAHRSADVKVNWSERQPGRNCFVTTALSQPHVIVRIPQASGTVTFNGRTFTNNCP